jgi:hypothetical protein
MVRWIFLLLVVANLIFFVWASNYLGREDDGREPARLKQQLQVDRLAIASREAALPERVCRRVGPIALSEAERLKSALEARNGTRVILQPIEETSYWVIIPPLSDKAAADKKAVELKRMGVTDFDVVDEAGPYRNAISLGSFHSEEVAKGMLETLAKKGVRSARVDTKTRAAERARLDVRGDGRVVAKGLAELLPVSAPVADCPQE